jgi:L-threonylcarbamoyladenylate synthase
MPPLLLHASFPAEIDLAAKLLREGRLVAFATETVYGLGANALSNEAVASIFAAKKRPRWDPLIVHLAAAADLARVTVLDAPQRERVAKLAAAFWPGPLTMLLPRSAAIPDAVTAGRPLVGVRVPAHPAAQALLRAAGLPIAAPSANLFGHTSPTTAAHVLADLGDRIDAVLDAGPATVGLESTVLDVTATPMIVYRPGAISPQQIEAVTGIAVRLFVAPPLAVVPPESLPSPGVGIRHYAPRARMLLVTGGPDALAQALQSLHEPSQRIGVLLPHGWLCDGREFNASPQIITEPWANWDKPESLASTLYAGLRALDATEVDTIVCPLPEPGGVDGFSDAIRDRLLKAARPAEAIS